MARKSTIGYIICELPFRSGTRRRRLASVPYFAKAERLAKNASVDSRLIVVERAGCAISTWLSGQQVIAGEAL